MWQESWSNINRPLSFKCQCSSTFGSSVQQRSLNSLCSDLCQRRACRVATKALSDDRFIYPYSLTRLGFTNGTGFQTHSQVWRTKELNHYVPLYEETHTLPLRHSLSILDIRLEPGRCLGESCTAMHGEVFFKFIHVLILFVT